MLVKVCCISREFRADVLSGFAHHVATNAQNRSKNARTLHWRYGREVLAEPVDLAMVEIEAGNFVAFHQKNIIKLAAKLYRDGQLSAGAECRSSGTTVGISTTRVFRVVIWFPAER